MKLKKLPQMLNQSIAISSTRPKLLSHSLNKLLWWRLVSAMLVPATLLAMPTYASELDVYEKKGPKPDDNSFGPKVMLVLPNSATMDCRSMVFDYPEFHSYQQDDPHSTSTPRTKIASSAFIAKCTDDIIPIQIKNTDGSVAETINYVAKGVEGKHSRMYEMIKGVVELLDNPDRLPSGTQIGLAYYGFGGESGKIFNVNNLLTPYSPSSSNPDTNLTDNANHGRFFRDTSSTSGAGVKQSGFISVPVGSVTDIEHVNDIKRALVKLVPSSNMPIAKAYAEVAAYMLGSSTADLTGNTEKLYYPIREKGGNYYMCVRFNAQNCESKYWAPLRDEYRNDYMQLLDKDSSGNYITRTSDAGGWTEYQYTATFIRSNDDPSANSIYRKFANPNANIEEEKRNDPTGYAAYRRSVQNFVNQETGIFAADRREGKNIVKGESILDITYKSPLGDISADQCSGAGAGVYFLTDGFANSATKSDGKDAAGTRSFYPTEIAEEQMKNIFNKLPEEDFSCAALPNIVGGDYNYGSGYTYTGNADKKTNIGYSGWRCIIPLAQQLKQKSASRNATIKTAVVGYGADYTNGISFEEGDNYVSIDTCTTGLVNDSKLACDWGNQGEGGFYVTKNGAGIADTIIDFAEKLGGGEYKPQSGDSLSIGANVTDATKSSSLAYLPLMEPRPNTSQLIWAGNVNKYTVKDGSLFDKNNEHIYDSITGQIKSTSKELWNNTSTADGGAVRGDKAAGTYAKLVAPAPSSAEVNSTRKVYVEAKDSTDITPKITNIKVDSTSGKPKPINFDQLKYTEHARQKAHYLLNFLGYDVPVFNPAGKRITAADYGTTGLLKDKTNPFDDLTSYIPTNPIRILGGVNNSKPQEIIYETSETYSTDSSATTTSATSANTTYMLFGSMDGALHLVDSSDGKEKFAFIPKPIIEDDHSIAALAAFGKDKKATTLADGTSNSVGNVSFGIDAPWFVRTKYYRKIENNTTAKTLKVTLTTQEADKSFVKVYGGLGRTGVGFYGLNITDVSSPSMMFRIDRNTSGFSRLGSTWSAPTEAKIKYKNSDDKVVDKDVLFISGGYDKCFDDETFNIQSTGSDVAASCATKGQTYGSAVYMIDADSGDLLWSTSAASANSGSEKYTKNENIKYSIVSEVSVIDSNLNGYVDNIYFADLGGQVFRADFDDTKVVNSESATTTVPSGGDNNTGWVQDVVRVLDTTVTGTTTDPYIPLRFYQRPVISAYRFNIGRTGSDITSVETSDKGSNLTYILSVASGDRNSPLAKLPQRKADKNPNKVFTIWNANTVSNVKLRKVGSSPTAVDSDLIKLEWNSTTGQGSDMSIANKASLLNGTKKGWYDDLIYFKGETSQDTDTATGSTDRNAGKTIKSIIGTETDSQAGAVGYNINYLKSFGQPALRGGSLYVSVYNRLAYIPSKDACSPVPTGVTETQEYCLPFGKCTDGRGMAHILGVGLSSANFAAVDEGSSYFALVTPDVVKFQDTPDPTPTTGSDPDPAPKPLSAIKGIYHSLYNLLPNVWFERTPAPPTTTSTDTDGG